MSYLLTVITYFIGEVSRYLQLFFNKNIRVKLIDKIDTREYFDKSKNSIFESETVSLGHTVVSREGK